MSDVTLVRDTCILVGNGREEEPMAEPKPIQPGEIIRVHGKRGQYRVLYVDERGHVQVLDRDEKSHWYPIEEVHRP